MATHSSTLAWRIPWTEEPGRLQSMGVAKSRTRLSDFFHFSLSCIGEGNGNPLQDSCLENPRVWGAWWAAVYGVARSRTGLKRLSSIHQVGTTYGVLPLQFCRQGLQTSSQYSNNVLSTETQGWFKGLLEKRFL